MPFVALLAQGETPDPIDALPSGLEAWDWITAGIIFGAAIILSRVVKKLLERGVRRTGAEQITARIVGRVTGYLVVAAGFVYALASLGVTIGPLLGALGVGGIALAFALQDTLQNFIAGIFLETRRPFRRGDQIMTNEYEGTVEDINLRSVIVRTFDGRRVILPNSMVINSPIVNFTTIGTRRTTLMVGVAYVTDLREAQNVILQAVRSVADVLEYPPPEAWVEAFADSSINFAVHFWHEAGRANFWRVRDAVAQAIKRAVDEAGITIPFPQVTLWSGPEVYGPPQESEPGSPDG